MFLVILAGCGIFAFQCTQACAEVKNHRMVVAVVGSRDTPYREVLQGFRAYLGEHDRKVAVEVYTLSKDQAQNRQAIDRLRNQHPRLILALGSPSLVAISREIEDIPIVFGLVLKNSLLPNRGNITGVTLEFPVHTQLQWIRRVLPEARTVGVVYNPAENAEKVRAAQTVARPLGLRLDAQPITSPRELPAALEALANSADVFWGLSDRLVVTPQTARSLLLFSFRNRIPFVGLSSSWVKAGALFSLDRDYADIGRQCGELAWKVLQGAKPAQLPAEPPRRVVYVLNQRTADQMKIQFPPAILKNATLVY
jgi:putative ABC transport system substrate-binding protein